ncbi:mitochondrial ribosomal protein L44 [Sergentomyia squamirostris]
MFLVKNSLRFTVRILQAPKESNKIISRDVKRWVSPTLKEIRRRREKVGPDPPQPRSGHLEWNYKAELYAFAQRLHEKFDNKLLHQAFTCRSFIIQEEMKQKEVGVEQPEVALPDNSNLIAKGEEILAKHLDDYINGAMPKVPLEGRIAIRKHLTSDGVLAHISSHIGTKDLILSADFPVTEVDLAKSFKAVVAALEESSGSTQTSIFIRDFVFTQLSQKDIGEIWEVPDPLQYLTDYCQRNNLGELEPRLIGECGKNTILATYHVGIYANRKLLGTGYGENIDMAVEEAAKDGLRDIFDLQTSRRPIDFLQKPSQSQ